MRHGPPGSLPICRSPISLEIAFIRDVSSPFALYRAFFVFGKKKRERLFIYYEVFPYDKSRKLTTNITLNIE